LVVSPTRAGRQAVGAPRRRPMLRRILSLAFFVPLLLSASCAQKAPVGGYTLHDAGRPLEVSYGLVREFRHVRIEGEPTGAGAVVGSTVGAVAGAAAGCDSYSGSWWGSLVGAILGGIVGQAIEKGASDQDGVEIMVEMDDGRRLVFVQGDEEAFQPGEEVQILTAPDGTSRVQYPRRQ
jgi:outer membrane lipoprotein SlyB